MSDPITEPTADQAPAEQAATETDAAPGSEQLDPETFPREYVVKLRDENAKYRQRAQHTDDLAHRLHEALVAATGRLADPSDLAFDEAHLDDADTLNAALDDLLTRKPHLATRRLNGHIGQGLSDPTTTVSLADLLRAGAN